MAFCNQSANVYAFIVRLVWPHNSWLSKAWDVLSRTPCMTVDDVGQRGNRSWDSLEVVDSWPSASSGARCYAVTMQYRAAPFETAHVVSPRLLRFAKSISSYLELSRDAQLRSPLEIVCSPTLKYRIYVCRYIGRACQGNGWFRLDSALISTRHVAPPRKLHEEYGASVCYEPTATDSMRWLLNS